MKVNCAALPAELLESELFGHEKGAFTGAATTRVGKFEQADTGTIFLDEIGEMKAALQAKLLHVLQDGQFTKLGSNKPINVDVRVVAATNRDLEVMLQRGEFREDLYYRLKVIEVTVPPLRERRGEILHLTDFFMDRYARRYNRPPRELSPELVELFQSYEWPGNIRELENMIKRIVILQDEQLVIRGHRRRTAPGRGDRRARRHGHAQRRARRRNGRRRIDARRSDRDGGGRIAPRRRRESGGAQSGAHDHRGHAEASALESPARRGTARRQLQDPAQQDQRVRHQSQVELTRGRVSNDTAV